MNSRQLIDIAKSLVGTGKSLLAIDESNSTCDKRFATLGIHQTTAVRRRYRDLIITTVSLGENVSGIILYDETIRQQTDDGASFLDVLSDAGIIPGIKVDNGANELAGSLSFGRAIQQPALGIGGGQETQRGAAQDALLHRAQCNRAARRGEYGVALEWP